MSGGNIDVDIEGDAFDPHKTYAIEWRWENVDNAQFISLDDEQPKIIIKVTELDR